MAWNFTGNLKGPQGEPGEPGVVPGNVIEMRAGTIEVQGVSNGNYWVTHGGSGNAPTQVFASVDTEHGGGAEGFHVTVSDLFPNDFMVHINDTSGANVSSLVRIHWLAVWI